MFIYIAIAVLVLWMLSRQPKTVETFTDAAIAPLLVNFFTMSDDVSYVTYLRFLVAHNNSHQNLIKRDVYDTFISKKQAITVQDINDHA